MSHTSFFGGSLHVSGPLWVWAVHFAFCYVAVAFGCEAGWDGTFLLRGVLAAGSLVALVAASALLLAACRRARASAAFAARVGLPVAALSLLGIAWTSAPVLVLPACHLT